MDKFKNYTNNSEFDNEEIDLRNFYYLLMRNKLLVFSITSITTIFAIIFSLLETPIYKGSFRILVKENQDKSLGSQVSPFSRILNNRGDIKTQEFILQSPSVLEPVYLFAKKNYEERNDKKKDLSYENWLKKTLKIKFTPDTNILNIDYRDSDKDQIINILNKIKNRYQGYSKEQKEKELKKAKIYFKEQQKILTKRTSESITKLNKFSIKHGLGDIDGFVSLGKSNGPSNQLFDMSVPFDQLNNSSILSNINNQQISIDNDLPKSGQRFANQFSLLEKYEADYINYSSFLKPNSKYLLDLKTKIDNLRTSLKRPNEILLKHRELIKASRRNSSILEKIETNLANVNLEIAKQQDPWTLISDPTISESRVSPQRTKNTVIAFIIGGVLSCLISFLKERKTGLIYDAKTLINSIQCQYCEEIFINNKSLSKELIFSILLEKNINIEEQSISFINLSNSFSKKLGELSFHKNIKISNVGFSYLENINQKKNIFFIINLGEIDKKEIFRLNKYIKINRNEIKGWFILSDEIG